MKTILKKALGRCIVPLANRLTVARRLLRPIGIRSSQGCFGDRVVSIQNPDQRRYLLTHVDECYLAYQLFWRGGGYYEPITRALIQTLVRPGDTFLDIGAHVGFFTLAIGLHAQGVKIIAFEPNPKNFRILRANAVANGLSDIVCEPIAMSDRDGEGTLYLAESDMSASLMKDFQPEDTKQIESVAVRTASLDSYLKSLGIQGPMVIKVDIEGHEPAFFRGAAETIAAYKPDIILEVLFEQPADLVSHLKSLGYHFYPITDAGLVELETPKLFKRFPFLFLNQLLSARPKKEIAQIFNRVGEGIRTIDLHKTTKYIPQEEWPRWWRTEPQAQPQKSQPNALPIG